MTISEARSIYPPLLVEAADPEGDATSLIRLALWCQRYSPLTRVDGVDGLLIDISGCAHLFGGEAALVDDLGNRLASYGLTARIAVASTIGACWALARHGAEKVVIVPVGETGRFLDTLPAAALRLESDLIDTLHHVGLNTIGLLAGKPRSILASRFGMALVHRLDQALGLEDERFDPLTAPPFYRTECRLVEPIMTYPAVEEVVHYLAGELCDALFQAGKATQRVVLTLFRVDGWHDAFELRTSTRTRDPAHLGRLLCERVETIEEQAGFGFDMASLGAYEVEEYRQPQHKLEGVVGGMDDADLARLMDRLSNRFGPRNVTRFVPRQSYIPERTYSAVSVMENEGSHDWKAHNQALYGDTAFARPVLLFRMPEPVSAIAEMPDRPPTRFEWRRIVHRVVRADGPERIAPEWWDSDSKSLQTRDYYRVEDTEGRRFWLFRDGLHERVGDVPRWFIHGVFA